MEDTKSKYEVFVINPTYTEEIQRLRELFNHTYADERVNILRQPSIRHHSIKNHETTTCHIPLGRCHLPRRRPVYTHIL